MFHLVSELRPILEWKIMLDKSFWTAGAPSLITTELES